MDGEGHILEVRERKLLSKVIKKFLVRLKDLPKKDVTGEVEQILQHSALQLFEDKQHLGGEHCNIPIN